jgi:hypothetical protein
MTIADLSGEFVLLTDEPETDSQRNGRFELEARSGRRNILQQGVGTLDLAVLTSPRGFHHIGTHHANFGTIIRHTNNISARAADIFTPGGKTREGHAEGP